MPFVYDKLWELLKRNNYTKEKLRIKIKSAPNTIAKMGRNESVPLDIIDRICTVLDCTPNDIIEYIPPINISVGDILDVSELHSQLSQSKNINDKYVVNLNPTEINQKNLSIVTRIIEVNSKDIPNLISLAELIVINEKDVKNYDIDELIKIDTDFCKKQLPTFNYNYINLVTSNTYSLDILKKIKIKPVCHLSDKDISTLKNTKNFYLL